MADFVGSVACPWWSCGMPRRPPSPGSTRTDRPPGQATGRGRTMTEASITFAGTPPTTPRSATPRAASPERCSGWQCRVGGSRRRRSSPWSCGATRPSTRPNPWAGQPGRGRGSAPAAGMDGRGWQRSVHRRGRGRGAGAKPAMGHGDDDQGHQEQRQLATRVAL